MTITLGVPTTGHIHHESVQSIVGLTGSGLISAVNIVPRLPVQQARTRIVTTTTTSHLLFADDDMVYEPKHLEMLLRHADKDVVCGLAVSRSQNNSRPVVLKYDPKIGMYQFTPPPEKFARVEAGTLAFTLIKMDVFNKVGRGFTFPPKFGEDMDFFRRCEKAGVEVWLEPECQVGHIMDQILYYGDKDGSSRIQ
jgi:hypothetical protein